MARFSTKTDKELLDLESNYLRCQDDLDRLGIPRIQIGQSGQIAVMNAPTALARALTEIQREKIRRGI